MHSVESKFIFATKRGRVKIDYKSKKAKIKLQSPKNANTRDKNKRQKTTEKKQKILRYLKKYLTNK